MRAPPSVRIGTFIYDNTERCFLRGEALVDAKYGFKITQNQ